MSDAPQVDRVCHRVLYGGNVQGVGFRYTVRSLVAGRALVGYVRNLPDGRVELLVEGVRGEVRDFLDAIRMEMEPYIHEALETTVPASGLFSDFRVRF